LIDKVFGWSIRTRAHIAERLCLTDSVYKQTAFNKIRKLSLRGRAKKFSPGKTGAFQIKEMGFTAID